MKIQLIYIATSIYCQFADEYFASLDNLFPGSQKIIDVFTDNCEYFDKFKNDSFLKFNVHKIYQVPYPMLTYLKFSYMRHVIDYDADITIFADADCRFLAKDESFWNNLNNHFSTGKVLITYHIMYYKIIHQEVYRSDKNPYYDILFLQTLHETDPNKLSYIPLSEYLWVQGCFCAGQPAEFAKFCNKLDHIIGEELKVNHYIPRLNEEAYMNKMLYDYYSGNDVSIQFVPNLYAMEKDMFRYMDQPPHYCFIMKDANNEIKFNMKNNLI